MSPTARTFTAAELAAFVPDALVEWRTGRYWYPGEIVGDRGFDHTGKPLFTVRYFGPQTRTNDVRAEVVGYPGQIRLPVRRAVAYWDVPCVRIKSVGGIPFQEFFASREVPSTAAATEVLTALGYEVGDWSLTDGQRDPARPVWNARVVGRLLR